MRFPAFRRELKPRIWTGTERESFEQPQMGWGDETWEDKTRFLGCFLLSMFCAVLRRAGNCRIKEVSGVPSAGLSVTPVAEVAHNCLVQVYCHPWFVRKGWLVNPGTNWVWRFHRYDNAWVYDPKVFMDSGMAMPN